MPHLLLAIGKLAAGALALTPAQTRWAALECQVFAWTCPVQSTALQPISKAFGAPVRVQTIPVRPDGSIE